MNEERYKWLLKSTEFDIAWERTGCDKSIYQELGLNCKRKRKVKYYE